MHSSRFPRGLVTGTVGVLLWLVSVTPVCAHVANNGGGLVAGLTHPVLGLDHFLAMFSVGVLSAQMGGRAIWSVPATFVGVMLAGGILGIQGVHLPAVEAAITASVIALGLALAIGRTMPAVLAMAFVGFFAVFHGYAHGTEMPEVAAPFPYALGFVFGTAGIHLLGVGVGAGLGRAKHGPWLVRGVGGFMVLCGMAFVIV
jgi:urease accessory protein